MNKLIIGLLILAAGAGIFFYLRNKKEKPVAGTINQELIIGKWKTATDSSTYEFQKNGQVIKSAGDSLKADTSYYEWNKTNDLVWKQKINDSTGKVYVLLKLSTDTLQVRSADSTEQLFTRLK
jgi:hypothetical protein